MNLESKRLENGIVEYTITNESHSLLNPLVEALQQDDEVLFASYEEVHPLKNLATLKVLCKNRNENQKIIEMLENLQDNLQEIRQQVDTEFE